MNESRSLPWDWYPGVVPENVVLAAETFVESTISFECYQSNAPVGLSLGQGSSLYKDTMLDIGPDASVKVGDYTLIHGAHISCDGPLEIGSHVLISWQVVLMDRYRAPLAPQARQQYLEERAKAIHSGDQSVIKDFLTKNLHDQASHDQAVHHGAVRPITIGDNVWVGFDACILPGVTIGKGSVVGARSVVSEAVPAYSVVAGNPARVIRSLVPEAA